MADELEWDSSFVPDWAPLPAGTATCLVRPLVNATLVLQDNELIQGAPPLRSRRPTFSFLLTHASSQTHLLFDLGIPAEYKTFAGSLKEGDMLEKEFEIVVLRDLVDLVEEAGVPKENITQIVISHYHWDHTGAPSAFPNARVVLGSPTEHTHVPALASFPSSHLSSASFDTSIPIGSFTASFDVFSDGSLVLLSAPGHTEGHVVALIRTDPGNYVLLAADGCHHTQLLEDENTKFALFGDPDHPTKGEIYSYHDKFRTAGRTLKRIRVMGKNEDVFVVLAHDEKLWKSWGEKQVGDLLNGWKEKGLKIGR